MLFPTHGFRRFRYSRTSTFLLVLAATFATPQAWGQTPGSIDLPEAADELPAEETAAAPRLPMDDSALSLQGLTRLTDEADDAIAVEDFDRAITKLQEARQWGNQLSSFYQQLSSGFSGIDNRIYQQQRRMALEAAQMRDVATYQLALLHRAQGQPELAVPLLVQIVASQNPTRELGNRAYRQLYELGFVESPFGIQIDAEEGDDENAENSANPTDSQDTAETPEPENDAPAPLANSILSLSGVSTLMEQANDAVTSENYDAAARKLQEARELGNRLSNYYQQLAGSFSGIENSIYEQQRRLALESAQLRDEATYQLALLHRAQNQPELAVPLLVEIVGSQNPTRELGKNAYRQLYELGFVNDPYSGGRN
ncbi:hypothetical protein [Baaleninema sp.]|uniref:hypothetical protein n=1 Tax=Baaleninema sp. TaxID=3101197 RepID=UPI003D02AECA